MTPQTMLGDAAEELALALSVAAPRVGGRRRADRLSLSREFD